MSTLEDAINRIYVDGHRAGIPICANSMRLALWVDTDLRTCTPITGYMDISFEVEEGKVFAILRAIDKATPIYSIKIKRTTYHITKTEEFMKKRCEA
jgi:hypothetical protein